MHDRLVRLRQTLQSRLKLRHLSLLQAIDHHRSISKVAIELGVSQPAITKLLKEVEEIFMTRLFDRTTRGLQPTTAGKVVMRFALMSLADLESTAGILTAIDKGLSGQIRIGVIPHVPSALITAAMVSLMSLTPKVSVMVREGTTDELMQSLGAHELDCVLGRSPYAGNLADVQQEVLYQQVPCLLVTARSRAQLSRGPLDWARLAALDWILQPPNTPMRRSVNAMFAAAGVQAPMPLVETYSIKCTEVVFRERPNVVTILAEDVAADLIASGTCAVLPYELEWSLPPITLFVVKGNSQQQAVQVVAESVRKAALMLSRTAVLDKEVKIR